jgi:hypothetical protein
MNLAPPKATVLSEGLEREVPTADVVKDDIVVIRPGNKIPVDGEVLEGAELSARTFCSFQREFSSFRRQGRLPESDPDPENGSVHPTRATARSASPCTRFQTQEPVDPGGRKAVSCR